MRKQSHPYLIVTKLQQKDGGVYKKRWVFFKKTLPLEITNKQSQIIFTSEVENWPFNLDIKSLKSIKTKSN